MKIGVLGGIGPEATGEFYLKLIGELQRRGLIKNNLDYPQVIINSIPAPELTGEIISNSQLESYVRGLKELDQHNPDFIVMVCNTVHLYLDILQKSIKTKIIDLREEVKRYLLKNKITSSLIIGTPNTIKMGLYRFSGISCLEPETKDLCILSDAIQNYNRGFDKEGQTKKVENICAKYLSTSTNTVILGCTEFAIMLSNASFNKINTIDILVDAVISRLKMNFT